MTLPMPLLDDLDFAGLVTEARESLPGSSPSWTDHNLHDPGITILELLAWLTEQTCYRLDRVPEANRRRFLALLGIDAGAHPSLDDAFAAAARTLHAHEDLVRLAVAHDVESLDDLDRALVAGTEVPPRATTALDLERIALATPDVGVARTRAFPGLDLAVPGWRAPGTVTVVVLTPEPVRRPDAAPAALAAVRAHLGAHRTIGTRVRVHGPRYVPVSVGVGVRVAERADPSRVLAAVDRAVRRFLHPLEGGPDGRGWPFGRDVYRTEVLAVAGGVPGVDLATSVRLSRAGGADAAGDATCPNLCIPAAGLVDLVALDVEVDG